MWLRHPCFCTVPALPTAPTGGAGSYGAPTKPVVEPDVSRLPSRPPFKAFVGNLAYDVTAQEVGEYFFQHYQVWLHSGGL